MTAQTIRAPYPRLATPRRIRSDLRFLRIYVYTVPRVTRYPKHAETLAEDHSAVATVDRIEYGLAGEGSRYRAMGWCILALCVAPPLLAGLLWSGMYWLPLSVYWWPFDRGNYGFPGLSLFESLSYILIAIYFVVTAGYLATSHDETKRLGTEYRYLLTLDPEQCAQVAAAASDGAHPRTEFVLRKSKVFAAIAALLPQVERA